MGFWTKLRITLFLIIAVVIISSCKSQQQNYDGTIINGVWISKLVIDKAARNPDELQTVVVVFSEKPSNYKQHIQSLGGEIIHDYTAIPGLAIKLPGKSVKKLVEMENIESIEVDVEVEML